MYLRNFHFLLMPKMHHIKFLFLDSQPLTLKMTNSLTTNVEPFTSFYALEIKIYSCT